MAIFFIQELNSKGLYVSSPKKKENRFLGFTSFIKREIGKVLVVVVQWRQRNVQKRVMHVQSCCFALSSLIAYLTLSSAPQLQLPIRELKQRRRGRQRERQKINRFD